MERRIINSFGTITLPVQYRKAMKIEGSTMLWVDLREDVYGNKEIVLKKLDSFDDIIKEYSKWAEVIARISEASVALVWNNTVLSMSSTSRTQNFSSKGIYISSDLNLSIKSVQSDSIIYKESVKFLNDGQGKVLACFKLKKTGDDRCMFVVVGGTKYEGNKITKSEEFRRFEIVRDIVSKI